MGEYGVMCPCEYCKKVRAAEQGQDDFMWICSFGGKHTASDSCDCDPYRGADSFTQPPAGDAQMVSLEDVEKVIDAEDDNYCAWVRIRKQDERGNQLQLCDSDSEGAFKVWRLSGIKCMLKPLLARLAKPAEQTEHSLKTFRAHRNFEMAMGMTFAEMLREELKAGKHD